MPDIIIPNDTKKTYTHEAYDADVIKYSVDFSPLSADNGTVSTSTSEVKNGGITISTPAILSNIVSFNVTKDDDLNACFILKTTFSSGVIRNDVFYIKGKSWTDNYVDQVKDHSC